MDDIMDNILILSTSSESHKYYFLIWSPEPNSVDLHIDGTTDKCSKGEDINFRFTGFAIKGQVVSKGQAMGPEGVTLKLKDEKTGKVKQETTSVKDGM